MLSCRIEKATSVFLHGFVIIWAYMYPQMLLLRRTFVEYSSLSIYQIIWPYCILLFQPVTRKICLRYLKLMSSLNMAICTRISYTLWVEWYYLKTNYLTLRSKVKVPWRSLWYVTHHLMVVHPHTKYNWPIWKDKKVMVRTSFAEKKQKKWEQKKLEAPRNL